MILIIGKVPPPIGGVTIYTERLIENLKDSPYQVRFLKLTFKNLIFSIYKMLNVQIVHVIASHPLVRFYYSLLCKILGKNLIITYTDNLDEFSKSIYNYINRLSLKWAKIPVVLNRLSFKSAIKINYKTKQVSTFVPPQLDNSNLSILTNELNGFLNDNKKIFCTNAFSYCIDKTGNELYGVIPLISIFNRIADKGLIICDPSGTYKEYCENHDIRITKNIKLLSNNVYSFIDVVQISDCVIRATSTDGDSLSIHEALFLGKDVLCSDCVDRPHPCILYKTNNFNELQEKIYDYSKNTLKNTPNGSENGFTQMLKVYNELT